MIDVMYYIIIMIILYYLFLKRFSVYKVKEMFNNIISRI